jgi:RNA polymerase sigma-70 factor (ECF subfamily)
LQDLGDMDLVTLAKAAPGGAAFDALARRHQAPLRAFLRRLSGDATLADDLAQEALLKAFRAISTFRGGSSFRSWLFAIALKELQMAKRRARTRPTENPDTDQHDSAGDDPRNSFSLDLKAALATLTDEERAAALLCDAAGFSHAEAARVMGAPLGSVKTYVARARERLRAALAHDDAALSA